MSRYIHLIGLWILALAMVGCQEEEDSALTDGTGLLISLTNDVEVTTKSTPAELGEPLKQKFKLKVVNDATPSLKYYEGNYKEGLKVSTPEGRFRLTAEYGTNPILALNDPYYKGDTIAEVEKDKTTPVRISCKVANALTSVVFGEKAKGQDFTADFSDYRVDVFVEEDENHTYVAPVEIKDNGKSAYYRAGTIPTFTFVGTVRETGKPYTFKLENDQLKNAANFAAGKHCKIILTMAKAEAGLKVEVSKVKVEEVDITETIPLDWLPKPKLEASEAFENNTLSIVETQTVSDALVKLNTATGLQDLKMKFHFTDKQFASLNDKEYLLSNAEDKAAIEALGIQLPTIGEKGQVIDFTSVVNKLLTNNGETTENTVELDVKSNNRWSSEDTEANRVYTLRCEKPEFGVSVYPGNIWTKEFTMNPLDKSQVTKGNYDIISKDIKYQFSTNNNEWTDLNPDLRKDQLNPGQTYYVRALYRNTIASEAKEVKTYESIQIPNSSLDEGYDISHPKKDNPLYTFKGGWIDTRNALTCHKDGANAFYVSKSSTLPISENNSTVAHMMTIGWGEGNTCDFGKKRNSKIKNISAGLVCVGQYEVSSGEIKPKEAYIRPTSISFVYKASPYNGDEFLIQIELVNIVGDKETVIGEGKLQSGNTIPSYTNGSVNVSYNEAYRDLPISHVRVLFKAGTKEDENHLENDFRDASLLNGYTTAYIIGSQFWLDSFTLNYDK